MTTVVPKKPGSLETRLSMAVLAVLLIVAGGVMLRQFHINPAVLALRPAQQATSPAPGSEEALVDTTNSDITPFSPPERFGPDTLYEKINGRADLYLSSGFVSLATQRFTAAGAGGGWVEMFVYDMATRENAFSVFSLQRREDAEPVDGLSNAYRTENALFAADDRFYLEVVGSEASEGQLQTATRLAMRFVEAHGGTTAGGVPGSDLFPTADLMPDTLKLINTNAFGYEQLDRLYTADYLIDGNRLTAYVSDRGSAEAASALALTFRQTLVSYGATSADAPAPIPGAVVLQFFDTYEIVMHAGTYLAGVHEASDPTAAGGLAERLAVHLESVARQ